MSLFEKFVSLDEQKHERINVFETFDNLNKKSITLVKRSCKFNHLEKLTQKLNDLFLFTSELQKGST